MTQESWRLAVVGMAGVVVGGSIAYFALSRPKAIEGIKVEEEASRASSSKTTAAPSVRRFRCEASPMPCMATEMDICSMLMRCVWLNMSEKMRFYLSS